MENKKTSHPQIATEHAIHISRHYHGVQGDISPRRTSNEAPHDVILFPKTQELGEAVSRRGPDSLATLSFQLCAPNDSVASSSAPHLRPLSHDSRNSHVSHDSHDLPHHPCGPDSSVIHGPIIDKDTSRPTNEVAPAVPRHPTADERRQLAALDAPQNTGDFGGDSAPALSGRVTGGTLEFVGATLQLRGSEAVQQPVQDTAGNVIMFSGESGMPLYREGGHTPIPVLRIQRVKRPLALRD